MEEVEEVGGAEKKTEKGKEWGSGKGGKEGSGFGFREEKEPPFWPPEKLTGTLPPSPPLSPRSRSLVQLRALMMDESRATSKCATANRPPATTHRTIASGDQDGTIKVWDLANKTGESVCTLTGHTGAITALAVWPGNEWLLSGSEDATIKSKSPAVAIVIFRVPTRRRQYLILYPPPTHVHSPTRLLCFPRANVHSLAHLPLPRFSTVWDTAALPFVCVKTLEGHVRGIKTLLPIAQCGTGMAGTEDLLLSGSLDTTIKVWRRTIGTGEKGGSWECARTLEAHKSAGEMG